jgi:hypothetical protein
MQYKRVRKHEKNKEKKGDKMMPKEASAGGLLWSQETLTGPFQIP